MFPNTGHSYQVFYLRANDFPYFLATGAGSVIVPAGPLASNDLLIGPFLLDLDTQAVVNFDKFTLNIEFRDSNRPSIEKLFKRFGLFEYEPPPPENNFDHHYVEGALRSFDGTLSSSVYEFGDLVSSFTSLNSTRLDMVNPQSDNTLWNDGGLDYTKLIIYGPYSYEGIQTLSSLNEERVLTAPHSIDVIEKETNRFIRRDNWPGSGSWFHQYDFEYSSEHSAGDQSDLYSGCKVEFASVESVDFIPIDPERPNQFDLYGQVLVRYKSWEQDSTDAAPGEYNLTLPVTYSNVVTRAIFISPPLLSKTGCAPNAGTANALTDYLYGKLFELSTMTVPLSSYFATATAVDGLRIANISGLEFVRDSFAVCELIPPVLKLLKNPKALKNWTDMILWFKYGVKPTWQDWNVLIQSILSSRKALKSLALYIKYKNSLLTRYGTFLGSIESSTFGTISHRANSRIVVRLEYPQDDNAAAAIDSIMNDFGFTINLQNVWNLVTLSFVFDWFVDLGEIFERLDREALCHKYKLRERIGSLKNSVSLPPDWLPDSFELVGSLDMVTYSRTYYDYLPDPPFDLGDPTFLKHWLEGILIAWR